METDSLFQLKFTAKQLNKQAAKAARDEKNETAKVKKALTQGNNDIAQLYAQNAIRKKSERLNLLRLASRIDAVASRVQTAVTMRTVTGNMAGVVKGMDRALRSMNMEKISFVMDKFETQFEDLDVSTSYYENATNNASAITTPQEDVDVLLQKVADENGLELKHNLDSKAAATEEPLTGPTIDETEDKLSERLRALRA